MKKIIFAMICSLLLTTGIFAQKQVCGFITDPLKRAIPNATISSTSDAKNVTTSDSKGFFKITIQKTKDQSIVITASGYISQTILVKNSDTLRIELEAELFEVEVEKLEEKEIISYKRKIAPSMNLINQPVQNYFDDEDYSKVNENTFKTVKADPLSTFSIDVDNAAYSNVRRFLNNGNLPPVDAVRLEEMINYFYYDYPQPKNDDILSVSAEYSECPWNKDHQLLHLGLQAKKIPTDNLPPCNLVFLLDVSGSMDAPNKLPLLKGAFKLLVSNLRSQDRVAIVVYAGAAGCVLQSTSGAEKQKIMAALENLSAGGSTAGGAGIELAYSIALENFQKNGTNRVVLATDGDFNVGSSSNADMERLIEEKRKTGIFLTCLGFGMGNYQDSKLETLANKGNGNYAYIDNIQEANKVLVSQFGGTLFTLAKDVKIQMEFNPNTVQAYRLVGYENRLLNKEDFNDDKKDAGEMGSGHAVTVLYEIIPVGVKSKFIKEVDDLKYQDNKQKNNSGDIATMKIRYKKPDADESKKMEIPIANKSIKLSSTSENFRFASSVAMFGMLLRKSEFNVSGTFDQVVQQAEKSKSTDQDGYRSEFIRLVKTAQILK